MRLHDRCWWKSDRCVRSYPVLHKGGFDGKLEIIRLVSLFLLGEINADLFANSYFILQLKDVIKTAMPFGYSDGTLASLGLVEEDE